MDAVLSACTPTDHGVHCIFSDAQASCCCCFHSQVRSPPALEVLPAAAAAPSAGCLTGPAPAAQSSGRTAARAGGKARTMQQQQAVKAAAAQLLLQALLTVPVPRQVHTWHCCCRTLATELSSFTTWLPDSSRVASCGSRDTADGTRASWLYLMRRVCNCWRLPKSSGRSVRLLLWDGQGRDDRTRAMVCSAHRQHCFPR